jgi:hypothetical protein
VNGDLVFRSPRIRSQPSRSTSRREIDGKNVGEVPVGVVVVDDRLPGPAWVPPRTLWAHSILAATRSVARSAAGIGSYSLSQGAAADGVDQTRRTQEREQFASLMGTTEARLVR